MFIDSLKESTRWVFYKNEIKFSKIFFYSELYEKEEVHDFFNWKIHDKETCLH